MHTLWFELKRSSVDVGVNVGADAGINMKEESTLTKAEMVDRLHMDLGFSKIEARQLAESFFEEIAKTLERGEMVKLSGFGNFVLWQKRARLGRNPKTGVPTTISARQVVTFKPGKKLRSRVRRGRRDAA